MNEEFVQFLWAESLIDKRDLITTEGEVCSILMNGEWNVHSGPDFKNAIVRIGGATWVGHVEVHLVASDWLAHGHHLDMAYQNVILHLVLSADCDIHVGEKPLPCIALSPEKYAGYFQKYEAWRNSKDRLPCFTEAPNINVQLWLDWLSELGEERFSEKINLAWSTLESTSGDIEMSFLILSARVFGGSMNADGMEILIRSIPWMNVRRRVWEYIEFEQWILHIASLSEAQIDEHLVRVLPVERLNKSVWLWGRLRPSSFPSVRIRQWSWYYFKTRIEKSSEMEFWLKDFWKDAPQDLPRPGKSTLHSWRVNIVPFLYLNNWDRQTSNIEVWTQLLPETNAITKRFRSNGFELSNAAHSQAVLKLYKKYCRPKKCLNCAVGKTLIKDRVHDRKS